jgi:hypothetical protein
LKNGLYILDKDYTDQLVPSCPLHQEGVYLGKEQGDQSECGEDLADVDDHIDRSSLEPTQVQLERLANERPLNELEKLHHMYGHMSEGKLKDLVRKQMVDGCPYTYETIKVQTLGPCYACLRGRSKAARVEREYDNSKHGILEKVGVDYKGPFSTASVHKYKGFILFSDAKSHYVKPILVKGKGEALESLKRFKATVVNKYDHTWKILQSDDESIFNSQSVSDWLTDNGMTRQLSTPYIHSMNGGCERDMQSVMDKARTLMESARVPQNLWEFAILYAAYIIVRSPCPEGDPDRQQTLKLCP